MEIVEHSNPMALVVFTAMDEVTYEIFDSQIVLMDTLLVKIVNNQIDSGDLDITFEKFIEKNILLDSANICCCRYDILDLTFLLPNNLLDPEFVTQNLIPYILNNDIPERKKVTKSEYQFELEKRKRKDESNIYENATGENIEKLLITNRNDILSTELIVHRLLRNPYEQFNNPQGIINALKQTTYYLQSKIQDVTDISLMNKVDRLHILLAKLRNDTRVCQVLNDLYEFQNRDAPYVNLILSYPHEETITERQIQILVNRKWNDCEPSPDLIPIITALKKTDYYKNKIKQDQIVADGPKPYHLLLVQLKKQQAKEKGFLSEDALYDYIVITLELLKRNSYKGTDKRRKLNEIKKLIKKPYFEKEVQREFESSFQSINPGLQTERKTIEPSLSVINVENSDDIVGNLDALFIKHNQNFGMTFNNDIAVGNCDTISNRENLINLFLNLHKQNRIKFPLFKTTIHYSYPIRPILKPFIDDYLIAMGYKAQPYISFLDENNHELNILTLNIYAHAPYCPICAVMNYPKAMNVIAELEIKYGLLKNIAEKQILDNIEKELKQNHNEIFESQSIKLKNKKNSF